MVNRFLMKLFNSNDMQTIELCRLQFNFKLPSEQIGYRCKKSASSEFEQFVDMNLANFRMRRQSSISFLSLLFICFVIIKFCCIYATV